MVLSVHEWVALESEPFGRLALALASAVRTSSKPIP